MTLRARIAIAMAILAGTVAIVVAVLTYVSTDNRLRDEVDQSLQEQVARFAGADSRRIAGLCVAPSLQRGGRNSVNEFVSIQCLNPDGDVIFAADHDYPINQKDRAIAASGRGRQLRTVTVNDGDEEKFRVLTVGVFDGGAIQAGRDLSETQRVLESLRTRLAIIVLASGLIAALIGWLIARRATKPLVQLTAAAEKIAQSGSFDVDVPPSGNDESGRLARSFSEMLDALRRSRKQQQQLVQDAGHELRTPLTSLRTNVEVLRRYENLTPEARQEILSDLESETRELGSLVDELVQLATDTYDDETEAPLFLDQIVRGVAERASRRTGRIINVDAEPASFVGKERGLTRAISNVIDNAAKFSSAPSPIDVRVRPGIIEVRDYGPGIDPADLPHLFDRFYRAASARPTPGSGLGLSIVEQIVTAHGGTASVRNADGGGAIFTLQFPV